MRTKFSIILVVVVAMVAGMARGDEAMVKAMYVNGFVFSSNQLLSLDGTPLTAGTLGTGDGAIIQIGYFKDVPVEMDPFSDYDALEWSRFQPLTGVGSPNEARHLTSIGDYGSPFSGPFGFFYYESAPITFDDTLDEGLPGDYPVRMGIRFYDGTTLEGSSGYNTVSSGDDLWLLEIPQSGPDSTFLNMDEHVLAWESGPSGAFRTSLAVVPEPRTTCFLLAGMLCLLRFARRRL